MNEALDMNNWKDESEDTRKRRNWWWQTLQKLSFEFRSSDSVAFDKWISDTHGIKVLRDTYGNFLGHHEIDDEKKYMVFLLKYA